MRSYKSYKTSRKDNFKSVQKYIPYRKLLITYNFTDNK